MLLRNFSLALNYYADAAKLKLYFCNGLSDRLAGVAQRYLRKGEGGTGVQTHLRVATCDGSFYRYKRYKKGGDMAAKLREMAIAACENAYAPYSNFKVGAAIRAASGTLYAGCNVENVAYPEGTCAEAGAIAAMVAAGETRLLEVYVVAGSEMPVTPCGGCRQKLAEFGQGDVPVTMATLGGVEQQTILGALLPGAFTSAHMED